MPVRVVSMGEDGDKIIVLGPSGRKLSLASATDEDRWWVNTKATDQPGEQ